MKKDRIKSKNLPKGCQGGNKGSKSGSGCGKGSDSGARDQFYKKRRKRWKEIREFYEAFLESLKAKFQG